MIKAIIFDLFGVIRPDNLTMTYRHFGGDPVEDALFIHDTIEATNRGIGPRARIVFAEHFNIAPEQWMDVFEGSVDNDQQVLDYIRQLRDHYKVALLSNISRGRLPELFKPGELETYFDITIGSGDIGYAKPEARAYETAAEMLYVRLDECVMVDDRQEYVDGARAAGMQAVLYTSLPQVKGTLQQIIDRTI